MKPKTHKRIIWAARDLHATYLYLRKPWWEKVLKQWRGTDATKIMEHINHKPALMHYGLAPLKGPKKLVVELTIRDA